MADKSEEQRREEVRRAVELTLDRWHELGIVDSDNGPLLPTKIRVRRAADGGFDETPCMLMLVDNQRRYQARTRARKWAQEQGLDSRREGEGAQDADLVKELESFEELAFAIREPKPPHVQMFATGGALFAKYKQHPLTEIYGQLNEWTRLNDPKCGELDPEQLWAVISEISREGHLLPLMRIDGHAQSACIALSARAALHSPMAPSHLRLPWIWSADGASKGSASPPPTSLGSSASS